MDMSIRSRHPGLNSVSVGRAIVPSRPTISHFVYFVILLHLAIANVDSGSGMLTLAMYTFVLLSKCGDEEPM